MNQDGINTKKAEEEQPVRAHRAYYEARPEIGRKGPSRLRQQFNKGMSAFLIIAAAIVFYFALLRLTNLSSGLWKVFDVLKPVIYGCAIAYLLNPLVKKFDRYLAPALAVRGMSRKRAEKTARASGVLASVILLFVLVTALLNLMVPELYASIRSMVYTLPRQINDAMTRLNGIQVDDSTTGALLRSALEEGTDMLMTWMRTDLLQKTNELMSNLTEGVFNVISEIFNILIGVIVSVYILFSKETFARQSKKAVYAIFNADHANMILHLTTKSNEIFGGFIIGKIIDSVIIGILCFLALTILKMPYTLLVSVIVGVTNVIPFFGPYIGAIPSAILIILEDPMKGVYFIIFILVLQQFDGNILGPKILGNSTGLSAFWVIVAILLGGGLFGFPGMVLGVPTFAVVYYIAEMLLDNRLEKKNLPQDSDYYDPLSYVAPDGSYVHVEEQTENKEKGD